MVLARGKIPVPETQSSCLKWPFNYHSWRSPSIYFTRLKKVYLFYKWVSGFGPNSTWGFCNSGYVLTLKLTSMFSNSNCPQSLSRGKIYGNGPADVAWAPNPYAGIFSSCLKLVNTFPIVFRVLTYSFYKRNLRPYFKGGRETHLQSSCEKRVKRRLRHVDDSDWYNDDVM